MEQLVKKINGKIECCLKEIKEEFLLGKLEISDEEYIFIKENMKEFINKENFLYGRYKGLILTIGCIKFAQNEYCGGKFWDELSEKLAVDNKECAKICKGAIEEFIKGKKLYFYIGHRRKGYITTILTHAEICSYYYDRFFEFVKDLYFKDLEEDYIEDEVNELIDYIRTLFEENLDEEEMEFFIKGSKMTFAKQMLPKGFRLALINSYTEIAMIVKEHLKRIHNINYEKELEEFNDERYEEWIQAVDGLNKIQSESIKNKERRRRGSKKFSLAKYTFENNKLYVNIPKQIINIKYLENDIELIIYDGEKQIEKRDMHIIKNTITVKSLEEKVEVSYLGKELRYEIVSGENCIFNSKGNLYRKYIIFDEVGDEKRVYNLKNEIYTVLSENEFIIEVSNGTIEERYFQNFKLSSFKLDENMLMILDNKYISLDKERVQSRIKEGSIQKGIIIKRLDNEFKILNENIQIELKCKEDERIQDFILEINSMKNSLENAIEKVVEREILDGTGAKAISFQLRKEVIGLYDECILKLRKKGEVKEIILEKFIKIDNTKIKFDKEYYIDEKKAKLLMPFEISGFDILGLDLKKTFEVNLRIEDIIKFNAIRNGLLYEVNIVINSIKAGFTEEKLINTKMNEIWWENIVGKKFVVKYLEENPILRVELDDKKYYVRGRKIGNFYYYDLEKYINYKGDISFSIWLDNINEKLAEVYLESMAEVKDVKYIYDSKYMKGIYGHVRYIGTNSVVVEIENLKTRSIECIYKLNDSRVINDTEKKLYFGEYSLNVYELIEDNFFGDEEKRLLCKKTFTAGDRLLNKMRGKKLKAINCKDFDRCWAVDNFYVKDLRLKRNSEYEYEGQAFSYKKSRKTLKKFEYFLAKSNPIKIKVIKDSGSEIEVEIVDSTFDGLIYDRMYQSIGQNNETRNYDRYKIVNSVKMEIVD